MKLDKYAVDRNYTFDNWIGETARVTCLDLLIADSLGVVGELIDNGLVEDLNAYYDSLNL